MHFDFLAGDSSMKATSIRAFQMLWNLNVPHRQLAVNGQYSRQVEQAILDSPAAGFPRGRLNRSSNASASRPSGAPSAGGAPRRTTPNVKCGTSYMNVRSAPGLNSNVIGVFPESVPVIFSGAGVSRDGFIWYRGTQCGGTLSGFIAFRGDWWIECTCSAAAGGNATAVRGNTARPTAAPASDVRRWTHVIRTMAPNAAGWIVEGLAQAMPSMVREFSLNTYNRQAYLLAQMAHESAGFSTTTEFASGAQYEGRADLGNTQPGDGVRFKGRGLIQLTGRANYRKFGQIFGIDLIRQPELLQRFPLAARVSGEFWRQNAINECADRSDFICATRRINGGTNGLADRQRYLRIALDLLVRQLPSTPAPRVVNN